MQSIFVTGTDTGIGKTIVSTILTLGLNGRYWKPIQSGLEDETDTQFVKRILGHEYVYEESYKLTRPLSPNHAADIDGLEIKLDSIEIPSCKNKILIIEGAGGVLVPLNNKALMIDFIKLLSSPCIIIAKSGLGTLNHTLLTIEALKKRNIPILGVVLNGERNDKNRKSIEQFGNVKVIMEIPRLESYNKHEFLNIFKITANKDIFYA